MLFILGWGTRLDEKSHRFLLHFESKTEHKRIGCVKERYIKALVKDSRLGGKGDSIAATFSRCGEEDGYD